MLPWARVQLRWTETKWKSVLWFNKSTFQIVLGNHERLVLREEKDHPDCYQCKAQKLESVMV